MGRPPKTKTNFIESFNLDNLANFVKERKFVVTLFSTPNSAHLKTNNMFFSTSIKFESKEVFFLEINTEDFSPDVLKEHFVGSVPEIRFYIYGIPKRFYLEITKPILSEWVNQILTADFVEINSITQVHPVDTHYVIYADTTLLKENPAHFTVLAKLVSPLTVYTGLDSEQVRKMINGQKNTDNFPTQELISGNSDDYFPKNDKPKDDVSEKDPQQPPLIFAFREYDKHVISVSEDFNLRQKASLITANEFPDFMECNDVSLRLIVEHKIPALVYFDINPNSSHWDKIKTVTKSYKEYFLSIFVNLHESKKCEQFFKEFLGVDQAESMRILDMHGKVKRYEFIGAFTVENIQLFFDNFVAGNLKKYSINERLEKNAKYQSLMLANSRAFKRVRKNLQSYALFYVYGHDDPRFEDHVTELKIVQSVFRLDKKFQVWLLDHLRNDLDGYYHHNTPFIVFVLPTGKVNYFEGPAITAEKLIRWILELVPFLEITEPDESVFGEL